MGNQIILKTTLTSGVIIKEDEKTGMYDISEMFKSVNEMLGKNKESRRWLCQKSTQELIEYRNSLIFNDDKNADTDNQSVTKQTCFKEIKGRKTKNGQIPNKLLGDPIIALDAASYMDVSVKNDVYEYYLDGKINERRKVKEQYKIFKGQLWKLCNDRDIFSYAIHSINSIVLDKAISGTWNDEFTKEQLEETYKIMVIVGELIDEGIIDTMTKLMNKFDKMYEKKWGHKPLIQKSYEVE